VCDLTATLRMNYAISGRERSSKPCIPFAAVNGPDEAVIYTSPLMFPLALSARLDVASEVIENRLPALALLLNRMG
jgi:hypothetical protein